MTIDNLKRVMWRLENKNICSKLELDRAIMKEIGIDPRTVKINTDALLKLGWVKRKDRWNFRLNHGETY